MNKKLSNQIAKHFREVYVGGNWTASNLQNLLANVTLQQANTKVYNLNSIATLVFHINYYVSAVLKVLQGQPLNASDKYSFDLPTLKTETDWKNLVDKTLADAETFATLIEQLPDEKLWEHFADEKYGNYYRNLHGIIEHTHYHIGQIAILKKIIASST